MKKITLVFVGIALAFSSPAVLADNKDIQVVAVVGKARAGGRPLRAGDHVKVNEIIETDENSGCKIRLGDRTVIDIAASSVFRVESVRGTKDETVTRLDDGAAKASVPSNSAVKASVVKSLNQKPKFYMKTKWSVIAVRGTQFVAGTNSNGASYIAVINGGPGGVDIMSPDRTVVLRTLHAGQAINGSAGSKNARDWLLTSVPADIGDRFQNIDMALFDGSASEEDLMVSRTPASLQVTGAFAGGAGRFEQTNAPLQPTAAGSANTSLVVVKLGQ